MKQICSLLCLMGVLRQLLRSTMLISLLFWVSAKLKAILDDWITPNQNPFIKGRLITDNIILASECMAKIQGTRKSKSGWCAIKLDMAMAYDKLNSLEAYYKIRICNHQSSHLASRDGSSIPLNSRLRWLVQQSGLTYPSLKVSDLILCFKGSWNFQDISSSYPRLLVQQFARYLVPLSRAPDVIKWSGNTSGVYTI
ncbi:hypothetical protein K1719_000172 [Acacia pycnantha]|nr:hypothetical protein K1719_000172 [Acacia pycnantha]